MGQQSRLTERVADLLTSSATVYVSPISFFEIALKADLGKWPEMAERVDSLDSILSDQGGRLAPLTGKAALLAATLDWSNRDPFDRLIAATAIDLGAVLVSADRAFRTLRHHNLTLVWT